MPADNGYKNGRPSDLTPEVHEIIVAAMRRGNYRRNAAALAGVGASSIVHWEKLGDEGRGREPYASFTIELHKAEAECEDAAVVEARATKNGAAWWLECQREGDWSAKVRRATAEAVDALTEKLRAHPELHKQVVAVLTAPGETPGAQH